MTETTASTLFPDLSERYNSLRPPGEATRRFRLQLSEAFLTPEQHEQFQNNPEDAALGKLVDDAFAKLLIRLGPLFWEGHTFPKYEVWLIHGHYKITDAEKMVSRLEGPPLIAGGFEIMEPRPIELELPPLPVDRWDYDGKPLEFKTCDDDDDDDHETEPPETLRNGFRDIMASGKTPITALGISVAPREVYCQRLSNGDKFVERTGFNVTKVIERGDRKHVTMFEPPPDKEDMFQIAWIPPSPIEPTNKTASYLWLNSITRVSSPLDSTDPATTISMCGTHHCQSCKNACLFEGCLEAGCEDPSHVSTAT